MKTMTVMIEWSAVAVAICTMFAVAVTGSTF